ncbi:MAG: metal-dependent hydrolase [Candidatus Micrarchaeota archaeon]
MRGNQHFLFTFFTLGALLFPLSFFTFDFSYLWLLFWACIGSLLPDVDVGKGHEARSKIGGTAFFVGIKGAQAINLIFGKILSITGIITHWLVFKPYSLILWLLGFRVSFKHRGIFHSLPAAIFTSIFLTVLVYFVANYIGFSSPQFQFYTFLGILFGFLFHLFHDSLTISGVQWLAPFLSFEIYGNHKTGGEGQLLPTLFIFYLMLVAIVPTLEHFIYARFSLQEIMQIVSIAIAIGWIIFAILKGIRIRK